MRFIHHLFIVLCTWFCILNISAQHTTSNPIPFRFATRAESQMLITNIDQFTTNWNQFDVDVRLQMKDGKKSQLLTVAMNATRNWSNQEKQRITKLIKELENNLRKIKATLPFPKEIILVKTSMIEEEGALAYTRENWIAIGEKALTQTNDETLQTLIAHKLFHILARNSLNFKKAMFQTLGFTVTDQEIRFPADLVKKRISNPDLSKYDSYASFTINGEKQNCAVILYTNRDYERGILADYLNIGLIPLNEDLIPIQKEGETIIYSPKDATDFYERVKKSTISLTPEETIAHHFALAVTLKTETGLSGIIEKIKDILPTRF